MEEMKDGGLRQTLQESPRRVQAVEIGSTLQVESLWRLKVAQGPLLTRKKKPSGLVLGMKEESPKHG